MTDAKEAARITEESYWTRINVTRALFQQEIRAQASKGYRQLTLPVPDERVRKAVVYELENLGYEVVVRESAVRPDFMLVQVSW